MLQVGPDGVDAFNPQDREPSRLCKGQIGQFNLSCGEIYAVYPVSTAILLKFGFTGDQIGLGVFLIGQFVLSRRSRLGKLPLFIQGRVKDSLYLFPKAGSILQLRLVDPRIRLIPSLKD